MFDSFGRNNNINNFKFIIMKKSIKSNRSNSRSLFGFIALAIMIFAVICIVVLFALIDFGVLQQGDQAAHIFGGLILVMFISFFGMMLLC